MTSFGGLVRELAPHSLLTLSDQLVLYKSHHGLLFLDQTVSDALGGEAWAVRKQASFEAAHALLSALSAGLGVRSAQERLDLASELFAAMGHGRIEFDVTAEGGVVKGEGLSYGRSFVEKYGRIIRQKKPLDAFAAGFCSAAASLAFPSDWGLFEADETTCVARSEDACSFSLTRKPERVRFGAVITRAAIEAMHATFPDDLRTSEAGHVASELASVLDAIESDARGQVSAFGVNLALVPASYLSQITFDTMHLIEKRTPELFGVFSSLVREAAQIGAFHLLGGALSSSMWRSAGLEPPAPEPEVRLQQLLGIARALGWGSFYSTAFTPGRSLVLRCPATHESIYYAVRHGPTVRTRLCALQGTALAIMQLLHRVDFTSSAPIAPDSYDGLFRSGTRFHVEETRSTVRGDDLCEVIVEALADR